MVTEKAMATHSSTLAWKIPWMEEPGRLQSMGSQRVGHDWVTSLSLFTFTHWRRKWQPTPVFLAGESQEPGGLLSMGSHRVGHDWSHLAAAAAAFMVNIWIITFDSFILSSKIVGPKRFHIEICITLLEMVSVLFHLWIPVKAICWSYFCEGKGLCRWGLPR